MRILLIVAFRPDERLTIQPVVREEPARVSAENKMVDPRIPDVTYNGM